MRTLTGRLVALAVVVAVASVLVTGVALLGLYRQGATEGARLGLARDATTVAATVANLDDRPAVRRERLGLAALRRQFDRRGIAFVVLDGAPGPAQSLPVPLRASDAQQLRASSTVSAERTAGGTTWLIEGRAVEGSAVLLAQPLDDGVAGAAGRGRLLLPLVLGLAGGALAGTVLARRLGRPLAELASAARRLSSGERDVRVDPSGPVEVADLAVALNTLGDALVHSEERQRRFLLDVSHELRTPLTAVTGYAEGLADGVITGDDVPAAARVIRDEAARLEHRVGDLLALARTQADDFRLEMSDVDLVPVVAQAAQAWTPRAAAAGVRLRVSSPGRVEARTDPERVRQMIDALVDNALRVLPPGAPLSLSCGAVDGSVFVQVRDGGPGLSDDDLAVAFERGRLTERYRGDRPVGTGLGLALVGELARRLGGHAQAGRAPEGGVSFTVRLPA